MMLSAILIKAFENNQLVLLILSLIAKAQLSKCFSKKNQIGVWQAPIGNF